jgi:nicotinamidase-related amidase
MPITFLDARTALIVVDLQKGIVAFPTVHPIADILQQNRVLLDAFRAHDLPVILVNVDGQAPGRAEQKRELRDLPADWTNLVPELNQQPSDHVVTKQTWGAFTNTGLEKYLKGLGITQVVITGVSTSAGVESTARYAHELGFTVTLAVDAMTDMNADAHLNSVTRIFPRIGETGSAADIVNVLGKVGTEKSS